MSTLEARIRANTKYAKKAYERLYIRLRKDDPELSMENLRNIAEKQGLSLNAFVIQAIKEKIEKIN